MNAKIFIRLMAVVAISFVCGCSQNPKSAQTNEQTAQTKVVYTCTMHPEVISNKPGKCPKCGMTLVEKKVPVDTLKSQPGDTAKKKIKVKGV